MKINRNNCEAYFLDYHEGKLSAAQKAELILFLEKNSDLKMLFEDFENISLEEEGIVFENKSSLKRQSAVIGSPSFEELCVADVEGEITSAQKKELNKLISENTSLNKEYQLYKKTKLVPEAIIFPDKLLLKKQTSVIRFRSSVYYYVAAAASVLLILGLFFLFRNDSSENKTEIANNTRKETSVAPVKKVFPETNNVNTEEKNTSLAKVFPETNNVKEQATFVAQKKEKKKVFPETNNKNEEKKDVIYLQEELLLVKKEEKKQPLPEIKNEDVPVVIAQNKQPEEYLSLKEAVASKIKTNLLADELPEQELKGDNAKKLKGWDIIALAAKGVRQLTGKDVDVERKYDANNQVIASGINIGKFGYERTVASR